MTLARALGQAADQLERVVDGTREYVGLLREVQRVGDIQPGPSRSSSGAVANSGGVIGGTASGSGSAITTGAGRGGQLSSGGGGGGSSIGGVPDGPLRFGAEPVPRRLGPSEPSVFLQNQVLQRLNQIDGTLRTLGAHGLNNRARDRAGSR